MAKQKVFGIGWAKTGTTTLGHCLRLLGFRHVGQRLDLVPAYASGDFRAALDIAAGADAFEDWPWILIYRELDQAFPKSKFILTTRDPQVWLRSYRNMLHNQGLATEKMNWIRRTLYGLSFPEVKDAELLERFEKHNREVQDYFARRDSLLVVDWEKGHGWTEICSFLGTRCPDQKFPHENRGDYGRGDTTMP